MTFPAETDSAMHHGAPRAVRGVLVATVSVLVALGGHLLGGGSAPSPGLLVALGIGAGALCHGLSREQWSLRAAAAVLILVQAAVHLSCSLAAAPTDAGPVAAQMVGWHVVATLVSALALARVDAVAHAAVSALAYTPAWAIRVLDVPGVPATGSSPARAALSPRAWTASASVRGPPG